MLFSILFYLQSRTWHLVCMFSVPWLTFSFSGEENKMGDTSALTVPGATVIVSGDGL